MKINKLDFGINGIKNKYRHIYRVNISTFFNKKVS